ncbi:MAG: hypothetical protein U1C33_03810 [Candidatus Cloacimonadaceae bacterium]|nr:hypothetical protein [Candidatus Cloacimonadaceae bacterium]
MQKIKEMLKANPHAEGSKALALLVQYQGKKIDCIMLNFLTHPPDFSKIKRYYKELRDESETPVRLPEMPDPFSCLGAITLCDHKTIREVYARLNKLIAIKATIICSTSPDSPHLQEVNTEINALKKYLSEVLRPGGAIKNYHPEQKKACQRISTAISRLLKKAQATHPEAVAIIRKNLKMGVFFRLDNFDK